MFRWTNLIATAVVTAALTTFFLIFLDPLLKCALIRGGEAAIGAEVEVDKVKTSLTKGKIAIYGLRVANPENPWTNLLEWKEAAFELTPGPLLEKKVIIQEALISGIQTQTPRQTSGALSKKQKKESHDQKGTDNEPSLISQKIQESIGGAKTMALGEMEENKKDIDESSLFKKENLKSLSLLEEGQKTLTEKTQFWQNRIPEVTKQSQERVERIQNGIDALKTDTGGDLVETAKKAKKIKDISDDIKSLKKDVEGTKKNASEDFNKIKDLMKQAKEAKSKDLDALSALMGLPSMDAQGIAKTLLGPLVAKKMSAAMNAAMALKNKMPAKNTKPAPKKPERSRGLDVEFPKEKTYPAFLLRQAKLEGSWPLSNGALAFAGKVTNVTSNPPLVGQPTVFKLSGQSSGSKPQALKIDALLDHTGDQPKDQADFKFQGLSLNNIELGNSSSFGASLNEGQGSLMGRVSLEANKWKGNIDLQVREARLEPKINKTNAIVEKLADALRDIKAFSLSIAFAGEPSNFDIGLESDIGKALERAVKDKIKGEIEAKKKALQGKLDALYNAQADDLSKKLEGEQSKILKSLGANDSAADGLLNKLKGKESESSSSSTPAPIPTNLKDLKKLFK